MGCANRGEVPNLRGVLRSLSDLVQYFSTLLLVRFYHGMR